MMNLRLKAEETFRNDLYATRATGVAIDDVSEHAAQCSLMLTDLHRNAMGNVMGGVMFTLADLAFAAAANSECLTNDEPLQWVSLTSNIHFLSSPKGEKLTAKAVCQKQGRTTCLYEIEITDSLDRKVAVIETTGIKL